MLVEPAHTQGVTTYAHDRTRQPSGRPTGGQYAAETKANSDLRLGAEPAVGLQVPADLSPVAKRIVEIVAPAGLRGRLTEDSDFRRDGWAYVTVTNDAEDKLIIGAHVSQDDPTSERWLSAFTVDLGNSGLHDPDHAGGRSEAFGTVYPGEAQAMVRSVVLSAAMQAAANERFGVAVERDNLRAGSVPPRSSWRSYTDPEREQAPYLWLEVDGAEVAVEQIDGDTHLEVDGEEVTSPYLRGLLARDVSGRLGLDASSEPEGAITSELQDLFGSARSCAVYQRFFA